MIPVHARAVEPQCARDRVPDGLVATIWSGGAPSSRAGARLPPGRPVMTLHAHPPADWSRRRLRRSAVASLLAALVLSGAACSSSERSGGGSTPAGTRAGEQPSRATLEEPAPEGPASTTGGSPGSAVTSSTQPASPPTTAGVPVDLALGIYWIRPYGRPDRLDIPAYRDSAPGLFPYVLFGSATNVGSSPVGSPRVVATWRDPEGAVVATARGPVVDAAGAPLPALDPGATADFVIVVDDPATAALVGDREPELWGEGG